jgi:hypothetical protein
MKYSVARDEMKQGDLIGFSGTGLVSNVIKVATLSKISHVGVVLKTHTNE